MSALLNLGTLISVGTMAAAAAAVLALAAVSAHGLPPLDAAAAAEKSKRVEVETVGGAALRFGAEGKSSNDSSVA
jgi:hypothetical protein